MGAEQNDHPFLPPLLLVVVLGLTAFRLLAASQTGLLPDEAYYWLWSKSPQAGYYDHPPMIAWWIWFSSAVFGQSAFAIRLLPVMSAAVDTVLTYSVAREIGLDSRSSAMAGLLLNAMLMFGLNAAVATPDAPAITFWLLALWALARLRRTGTLSLWLLVGLFAGLGCVSKYTNFFLGPGICLCIAVDRDFRARCSVPWIAAGLLVAAASFAPVFVWNMHNEWVSFIKQFGRIGETKALGRYLPEFVATQFVLLNPLIAGLATLGLIRLLPAGGHAPRRPVLFLMATSAPLAGYMMLHSMHDRVQGNWLLPVYPSLAILATLATRQSGDSGGLLSRLALLLGIGVTLAVNLYMASPWAGTLSLRSPADGAVGWQTLAERIHLTAKRHNVGWIGTANYGVRAELTYHLPDGMRVIDIAKPTRYAFEGRARALEDRPGLLVLRARDAKPEALAECFGSMVNIDTIGRYANWRELEKYYIIRVENPVRSLVASGCH
jgi:4-amino-4-deoxy-L-arabinose transferase-like glycosyltransferase